MANATGVFSSRTLERAAYGSVAFRCAVANEHPHHGTIGNFRGRFLKQIQALFVAVLRLARGRSMLKRGRLFQLQPFPEIWLEQCHLKTCQFSGSPTAQDPHTVAT